MMGQVTNIITLAILGIIAADALARPQGLQVALNGAGNLWGATVGGLQATQVKAGG